MRAWRRAVLRRTSRVACGLRCGLTGAGRLEDSADPFGIRPIDALSPYHLDTHQAGFAQDCQMRRYAWLWYPQARHQIASRGIAVQENGEQPQSRLIGQGLSELYQGLHSIYLILQMCFDTSV